MYVSAAVCVWFRQGEHIRYTYSCIASLLIIPRKAGAGGEMNGSFIWKGLVKVLDFSVPSTTKSHLVTMMMCVIMSSAVGLIYGRRGI